MDTTTTTTGFELNFDFLSSYLQNFIFLNISKSDYCQNSILFLKYYKLKQLLYLTEAVYKTPIFLFLSAQLTAARI